MCGKRKEKRKEKKNLLLVLRKFIYQDFGVFLSLERCLSSKIIQLRESAPPLQAAQPITHVRCSVNRAFQF